MAVAVELCASKIIKQICVSIECEGQDSVRNASKSVHKTLEFNEPTRFIGIHQIMSFTYAQHNDLFLVKTNRKWWTHR